MVGLEFDEALIKQARLVKEGLEWTDSATYNLNIISSRIEGFPDLELGRFDLVTALCRLYEMDDQSIDRVIRHVSTLTDCFVIQCNLDLEDQSPEIRLKASVDYSLEGLKRNGFSSVKVVAPLGYQRPLLIGYKRLAGGHCG